MAGSRRVFVGSLTICLTGRVEFNILYRALMGATRVYAKNAREGASLGLQVFELRVIEIFRQQYLSNSVPRE